MNFKSLTTAVSKTAKTMKLKTIAHSPELLVGAGIIGLVGAGVLACKQTLKADDILKEHAELLNCIKTVNEDPDIPTEEYSTSDYRRDLTRLYMKTAVAFAKLYGVPFALGLASIAAILNGHKILAKRFSAVSAAYAMLDKAHKEYRARVSDELGVDVDKHFAYGTALDALKVDEVVDKNGNKTEISSYDFNKDLYQFDSYGPYACMFDECSREWIKDSRVSNYDHLCRIEEECNEKLRANGHLFLNEVLDALDIPRKPVGQHVGWVYDLNDSTRDSHVDFGFLSSKGDVDKKRAFITGDERSIILDFNCDGVIWNLI